MVEELARRAAASTGKEVNKAEVAMLTVRNCRLFVTLYAPCRRENTFKLKYSASRRIETLCDAELQFVMRLRICA
jgi:hypothetical protein